MPLSYSLGPNGLAIFSGSLDTFGQFESGSTTYVIGGISASNGTVFQILIPSASTGEDEDTIALFITSSGKNPLIGVGTTKPKSNLDIRDVENSNLGTKFLLSSARTDTEGAEIGDSAGSIFFSIDSGSYADPFTTGSVASLRTIITSLSTTGSNSGSLNSSGVFRIDSSPVDDRNLYNIVQVGFFPGSAFSYQGDTNGSATVHISGSLKFY